MLYVAGHEHAGVVVSLNCEFCSVLKEKREKRKREKRKREMKKIARGGEQTLSSPHHYIPVHMDS